MKNILTAVASFLSVGILSVGLVAQTASARYDSDIQTRVSQQLTKKSEFRNLQASTEDGIVTLTGTVDLYQQKLDAANREVEALKTLVAGLRKEIDDILEQLEAQLARSFQDLTRRK